MIARLRGTLVERAGTDIILDCNGVGYEVVCSGYTLAALPALGEPVTLKIFTHALESKITLYGFFEQQERALFDLLITVKNVGPATANGILSGANPRDIATLIAKQDTAGLVRIKGVGKKTAEMLVVELHEKCEMLLLTWTVDGELRPVAAPVGQVRKLRHPVLEEVAAALSGMGWRPPQVESALAELTVTDDATLESLLRQALRSMPR